ncbi:hypothetical protein AB3X96_38855, partial [Paraburkholderia sp. BR13439]|uniref:hypothetical protein n=1 Tax=Paraburkholderia sp. BR13439 TaxID=3236996 RepID=UPI0034CD47AB
RSHPIADSKGQRHRSIAASSLATGGSHPLVQFAKTGLLAAYGQSPVMSVICSTVHHPFHKTEIVMDAVELIIDRDANLRLPNNKGKLPIHYAAKGFDKNAERLVQVLLDRDPSLYKVRTGNAKRENPIEIAKRGVTTKDDFGILVRFWQAEAHDPSVKWTTGRFWGTGTRSIENAYPSEIARVTKVGGGKIHLAARVNDVEYLTAAEQRGENLKVRTPNGTDPLTEAIKNDSVEAYKWLIENVYTEISDEDWAAYMKVATQVKSRDGSPYIPDVLRLMQFQHVREQGRTWLGLSAPGESTRA